MRLSASRFSNASGEWSARSFSSAPREPSRCSKSSSKRVVRSGSPSSAASSMSRPWRSHSVRRMPNCAARPSYPPSMWRRNCWSRSPRPCCATRSLSSRRPSAASACLPARTSSWMRSPTRCRVSRSTPTRRASASRASVSRVVSAASLRWSGEDSPSGTSGSWASRLSGSSVTTTAPSSSASSASRSPPSSKPSGKGSSSVDSVRGGLDGSSVSASAPSFSVRLASGRAAGAC